MKTIEIENRYTGKVMHTVQVTDDAPNPLRSAVEQLVNANANLRDANLTNANLGGANLTNANLRDANLTNANLTNANLGGANLGGANLTNANLRDANLTNAYLTNAYLGDANLTNANLGGANLRDANLTNAYLGGANLVRIRDDVRSVLDAAPDEVPGVLAALREGRVNGSCYEGDCACLVGTIAKERGCGYQDIPGLEPESSRPAERWFLAIKPGASVETCQVTAITVEWIEEWLQERGAAQ